MRTADGGASNAGSRWRSNDDISHRMHPAGKRKESLTQELRQWKREALPLKSKTLADVVLPLEYARDGWRAAATVCGTPQQFPQSWNNGFASFMRQTVTLPSLWN